MLFKFRFCNLPLMTYKINLTDKEVETLKYIVNEYKDRKDILKRAYCILLRNEGQKNENIIRLLGIHEDSIADWTKIYMKNGIDGLMKYKYSERRKSSLHPYRRDIARMASAKRIKTIQQLQQKIKEKYDLEIEYSWLYRYCRKYGIYAKLRK